MYKAESERRTITSFEGASTTSSVIEKLIEYRFLANLGAYLARFGKELEVLRSDVDRTGHDLVLEAKGIFRHVQMKSTVAGGKRASVTVNTALAGKPSGCIIWLSYDPVTFDITEIRWFGGCPGEGLPSIGERRAKHSRANSKGIKNEREQHRILAGGKFRKLSGIAQLAEYLFGIADPDELLRGCLGDAASTIGLEASLSLGSFADSIEFAHLVDGYQLLAQLGHDDFDSWLNDRRKSATLTGEWPGTTAELWITLFLEHRHYKFAGENSPPERLPFLDGLARQLRNGVQRFYVISPSG